jgi:hypothetical protein
VAQAQSAQVIEQQAEQLGMREPGQLRFFSVKTGKVQTERGAERCRLSTCPDTPHDTARPGPGPGAAPAGLTGPAAQGAWAVAPGDGRRAGDHPNAVLARTEEKPPDVRDTRRREAGTQAPRGVPKDCRGNPPGGSAPHGMARPPPPAPRRPRRRPPRPPRPPRRITIRRGEPSKRIGIALVAVAVVSHPVRFYRLVQIQGMEASYYRQVAKKQTFEAIPLPAMRGTIRCGRAGPGREPWRPTR